MGLSVLMKFLHFCSSAAERADGTLGSKASDTSPISREKSVTPRRRPTTSELWKAELLPNKNGGVLPLELGSESALVGYVAPRKSVAGREEALSAALQRKGSRSRRVRRSLLPSTCMCNAYGVSLNYTVI